MTIVNISDLVYHWQSETFRWQSLGDKVPFDACWGWLVADFYLDGRTFPRG